MITLGFSCEKNFQLPRGGLDSEISTSKLQIFAIFDVTLCRVRSHAYFNVKKFQGYCQVKVFGSLLLGRGKKRKKSKSCTHHQISTVIPLDSPPNAGFKDIIFMYKTILLTKYKLSEKYQLFNLKKTKNSTLNGFEFIIPLNLMLLPE